MCAYIPKWALVLGVVKACFLDFGPPGVRQIGTCLRIERLWLVSFAQYTLVAQDFSDPFLSSVTVLVNA